MTGPAAHELPRSLPACLPACILRCSWALLGCSWPLQWMLPCRWPTYQGPPGDASLWMASLPGLWGHGLVPPFAAAFSEVGGPCGHLLARLSAMPIFPSDINCFSISGDIQIRHAVRPSISPPFQRCAPMRSILNCFSADLFTPFILCIFSSPEAPLPFP